MRRLEAFALALFAAPALAQLQADVSLEDVLRMADTSPRITAAARDSDAARAEREQALALPNPSVAFSHSRPSGGTRSVFDAGAQEQASVELPVPVFGQRGARVEVAERQLGRAQSQQRLTAADTRRLAGLAFARLLAAQEQLGARRAALDEVGRIRGLVAGRLQSGMASRYDEARADAELALSGLALQKAQSDANEQAAALAGALGASGWRPHALGSLGEMQALLARNRGEALPADSPAARVARDELAAAEARVELARREQFPVPSLQLGRTWTSGPFGAANFIGVTSEIPILDDRRALVDKARAEAAAARERERAVLAGLQADYRRHLETLRARRTALERFEKSAMRQSEFLEMAESAYRLGRGTLFELLDAHRTQAEAASARIELLTGIAEAEIELRALAGEL